MARLHPTHAANDRSAHPRRRSRRSPSSLRLDEALIELVEFERRTGVAVLRMRGDCPDCAMSVSTLREGIEAHLRMRVPEMREVRAATTDAP